MSWWQKLKIDSFLMIMILVVILATLLPAQGEIKVIFQHLTTAAIALLFFLHGAKLSREAILSGLGHWRLHLVVFASTFVLFPLLGLGLQFMVPDWMSPTVYMGFLYLCALPATVQSAIAFTSVAGGNVAAAICSASASSILGVFLSPVLVVYVAFSEAVVEGIWHKIDGWSLLTITIVSCVLLAIVLVINIYSARWLGFNKADEITIVFCGSKKSLANGVPMANVLFPAATVGIMLLPLMLFHQIQLMVCAILAQRYANQAKKHHQ